MGQTMGITYQKVSEPAPRGERVAAFLDQYFTTHPGLSLGELAFRLKTDKRDLQRLMRDRSCGWRLEDALAAYFGEVFIDAVFRPVVGDGPSLREKELERERAEIAARRERLERDRSNRRMGRAQGADALRLVPHEGGQACFRRRR